MPYRFRFDRLTGDDLRHIAARNMSITESMELFERITPGAGNLTADEFHRYGEQFNAAMWEYLAQVLEERDAGNLRQMLENVDVGAAQRKD